MRSALVLLITAIATVGTFIAMLFVVVAFDVDNGVMPLGEVSDAASSLRGDPVYVDPRMADHIDGGEIDALRDQVKATDEPTMLVLWPAYESDGTLDEVATSIARSTGKSTRVLLVTDEDGEFGFASTLHEQDIEILVPAASSLAERATAAVTAVAEVEPSGEPDTSEAVGAGGYWGAAALALGVMALVVGIVIGGAAVVIGIVLLAVLAIAGPIYELLERRRKTLAAADLAPSKKRTTNRGTYRPSTGLLLRLNRTRAGERTQRLRTELLALGERVDAYEGDVAGAQWRTVLDCYATAARIADTTEDRVDLSSRADIVAGLVLVLRGREAFDAIEADSEIHEERECFANPFHGRATTEVATIRLGSVRPPQGTAERVWVCQTCASAVRNDVAAADPLSLEQDGKLVPYWMLGVAPWSRIGYGATSRELIAAWNSRTA